MLSLHVMTRWGDAALNLPAVRRLLYGSGAPSGGRPHGELLNDNDSRILTNTCHTDRSPRVTARLSYRVENMHDAGVRLPFSASPQPVENHDRALASSSDKG